MSNKKYWSSFAELNNKEKLQKLRENEFEEDLPFGEEDGKGLLDAKTPRRDFLKYLGFSTAAATLAASCKTPVRKAIPFTNRPENITPGVAKYYASTYVQDGDVLPIVVKVRDGRPIKIEGNEKYPLTLGGTSPRAQASILDLYDMYRLPHPKHNTGKGLQEVPSFEQADTQIKAALAGLTNPVVLLTSTIVSPSTKKIIAEFMGKFPGSTHVQYDAVSYSGLLEANGGKIPAYQFDKAARIVSLDADFLGTWLSPVEFARQYSQNRKMDDGRKSMSRHFQFESYLSMTGACADERYTHRPSETGAVALALLAALGGGNAAPTLEAGLARAISTVAGELNKYKGASLVVSGSNDVNVQTVVAEINRLIGANGSTIDTGSTLNYRQGRDADMRALVSQMNQGNVGAILIYGANPAYDYYDAAAFKAGLKKVPLSISFTEKLDETTELCQWAIPNHHYLESWGDAEPRTGFVSFMQPCIFPLYKTRPFQTSLLKWSDNATPDYETYFRNHWKGILGGDQALDKALQDGILQNNRPIGATAGIAASILATADTSATATIAAPPSPADTTIRPVTTEQVPAQPIAVQTTQGVGLAQAIATLSGTRASGKTELVLYQNVAMGTGKQAGNPWLLELPDPISRSTWDNYAMISTKKAKELGIDYESSDYEYYQEKPTIELTAGAVKVTLPVLVIPGMNPDTIAVAVGYGRSANFAKAVQGVGQNVYPFSRLAGNNIAYYTDVTTSAKTLGNHQLAQVQKHNSYEGRVEVVRETTMGTFIEHPNEFKDWRTDLYKDYASKTGNYRAEGTLYPDPETRTHEIKWGMSIDLNSCIGCGACVVACNAENNVPVVGKNEVLRAHEMHWLRIDRYFVTDEANPDNLKSVVFQPMLCQHCDNAPCENVCPVAATMHNSEGINQMAYNRCIGTRYCANNCPYKVRRFNWGDYTGASTHGVGGPASGAGKLNDVVHQMNDELTRMVLNPDVVTRSRGVMEKCTFCIQRTQEGKLKAKMENRELGANEVVSACAQACPTSAIVFGNVLGKESQVAQIRNNNTQRLFYVLEQIHTLPNINYLAKIRNTDEVVKRDEKIGEHAGDQQKGATVPSQHEPAKEAH